MKCRPFNKMFATLLGGLLVLAGTNQGVASAILAGFNSNTFDGGVMVTTGSGANATTRYVAGNDDKSTDLIPLGFSINFFGKTRSGLYINNNGNVTFDVASSTFTPFDLTRTNAEILAPFFGDVDTRGTGNSLVTYGSGTVDGHQAFGVNWPGVGYYSQNTSKLNIFQLVIIDRSDIGAGNWDFQFNYDQVKWETGGASGGTNGLGGNSARAGFSLASGTVGACFEMPGSAVNGYLLDGGAMALIDSSLYSTQSGRDIFSVRDGVVILPPAAVWAGGVSNLWSEANWIIDQQGGSGMTVPASTSDVIFSASGATHLDTILDRNFMIKSLTISGSSASPVTISGTNTLTILGTLETTGITVERGAGLFTMNCPLVLAGASQNITVDNADGMIINGSVGGVIGLEKWGLGTLVLAGSNTYTGSTTVEAGILQIGNGTTGSIQSFTPVTSGTITTLVANQVTVSGSAILTINMGGDAVASFNIANSGTVAVISPNTTTLAGNITGTGGVIMYGLGQLNLTGTNLYSGDTTVGRGTVKIGNGVTGSISGSSRLSVYQEGTLILDSPDASILTHSIANDGSVVLEQSAFPSYTYSGPISGLGGVTKTGTNTLIFSGSNTYGGATIIDGGTFRPLAGALPALSPVVVNSGATFDAGGFSFSIGSLSGAGTVMTTSGLSVGANNGNAVFAGGITGSGTITKVGSGAWFLTGENTYVGPTVISEGLVAIGNGTTGSILGSSSVSISGSGALAVNLASNGVFSNDILNEGTVIGLNANTNTLSGAITGAGSFIQNGSGQTILTGSNTYTGATTVAQGTLKIGNGTTGSISGSSSLAVHQTGTLILDSPDISILTHSIANDGMVVLEESAFENYTFSGSINGAGSITKTGANTLTLGGTNTYAGITVVAGGILRTESQTSIPNGSAIQVDKGATLDLASFSFSLGSLTGGGAVVAGSSSVLTVGGYNSNTLFAGTINGAAELQKVGGGTWTLTGASTSTGLTSVFGGSLLVNGSIQGDLHVLSGILGGSGVIHGNVVNKALVSPGNSPGKLTIGGNYSQTSTGSLLIQLASRTVADQLVVGGAANLDGSLQVVTLGNYRIKNGATYTILTAANGVTGKFIDIATASSLKLDVIYETNSVILKSFYSLFSDVSGLTPNERVVAKTLDKMLLNAKYDYNASFNKVVDSLNQFFSTKEVPLALEQLVPTDLVILPDASFNLAQVQAANLERRMEEIRSGYAEFHAATTSPSTYYNSSATVRNDEVQYLGADGRALCPTPLDRNLGFFLNGSGEFVNENSTTMATAGKFTTGGVSTGGDYRFNNDWLAVGLTAGYANTSTEGRGDGVVGIDSGNLGVYTTAFRDGFYVNGIMGGGCNNYDVKRDTLGGLARGDTSGYNFNALLGTGYTCYVNALSVGPIASLRYSWVGIDGFAEHGSLAPLDIQEQNKSSVKSTLGFQVAYALPAGSVTVKPQVRAQWKHEYANDSRDIGASFLNNAYTVTGPTLGTDSLLVDVGVTVQINPALGVYAYYNGDIGASNYTANSVFGGVQVNF